MSTRSDSPPREADEETGPEPPGRPDPGRRRRRPGPPRRRLFAPVLAGCLAAALAWTLWTVPATHEILLDSFTERPQTYAELFFTGPPGFEGSTVVVPVAVTDHGEGAKGYQVRVSLESPSGQILAASTTDLKARYGAPVKMVARLQTNADVALVRVALVGRPQSLYFRFGKSQTPHA
ncbi:hypothetical protein [Kitasatospora paranensis]|uniref:Uncharacterized protein n=1 Tax=Kitasatospora paranensis TaxID=258053 RepID=A0ABW2FPJ7_9ACTN